MKKAREMVLNAGLREKELRVQVLGLLLAYGRPVSHNELMALEQLSNADRVSVYRNLFLLKEAELVHTVQGIDGVERFCAHDTNMRGCPGGHAHFVCVECKKMVCLKDQVIPLIDVPPGFIVEGKQLLVYGKCAECAPDK